MSRPDPTDLLCRLWREERGPETERRLAELLASSPEARLVELSLAGFERESQACPGDEVLLSAISERAILEAAGDFAPPPRDLQRSAPAPVRRGVAFRGRSRLALAVAAAIVMMCGLAYGLHAAAGRFTFVIGGPTPRRSPPPPEDPAPLEPSSAGPAISASEPDAAPPRHPAHPWSSAAPAPSAGPPRSSVAILFSEANAARRAGREQDAVALYQRLLFTDPLAREAPPARLALAKLLRGQSPAAALTHFETLARATTPLRAEALWGIAGCAQALGQTSKEKQALSDLIREFPTSPYASTARARLGDASR